MKVKIVSCGSEQAWYVDQIGKVYEVDQLCGNYYRVTNGDGNVLHYKDIECVEDGYTDGGKNPNCQPTGIQTSLEILQSALKDFEDDVSLQIRGGNVVVKHNDKLYVIEPSEASELFELLRKLKAFEVTV